MEYLPIFSNQLDIDYISHHGIKGMHWGVRRYQNPDGSYTKLGKQHRSQQEPSITESEKQSSKSISDKTLKFIKDNNKTLLKVGATSAALAIGTYGATKLYSNYRKAGQEPSDYRSYGLSEPLGDHIDDYSPKGVTYKAGQKLQRVSASAIEDFKNKGFTYVSHLFRDNQFYKSSFRKEINFSGDVKFVHTIRPKKDLKIASPRDAAKKFHELYPKATDDAFRRVMHPYHTGYEDDDDPFEKLEQSRREKLVRALQDNGYSGFVDIQDSTRRKISQPVVLFDPDSIVDVTKSRRIGKLETFIASKLQ